MSKKKNTYLLVLSVLAIFLIASRTWFGEFPIKLGVFIIGINVAILYLDRYDNQ